MKIISKIEEGRLSEKTMKQITGGKLLECSSWSGSTQCVRTFNTCSGFEYKEDGVLKTCKKNYTFICPDNYNPSGIE